MSLLFLESYDDGHVFSKWTSHSTTPNSSYARTGINGGVMDGGSHYGTKVVSASDEHATFIAGAAVKLPNFIGYSFLMLCSDSGATVHVSLNATSGGVLQARRGEEGTLLGSSASGKVQTGVWHYIELKATLHDTTGTVDVQVDGTNVISLTSQDTKNGGTKSVFDSFKIHGESGQHYFDDIYLCNGAGTKNNDFLGDTKVYALAPSGNGNYSQLVGSDSDSTDNYLLVDEAPTPSGTDYVGSATVGNKDTYTYADLTPTSGTIHGVYLHNYAQKTDTGAKSMRRVVRSGGTDSAGSDLTLPTSWAWFGELMEQNPVGPADWTVASVNAAEFGVEVRN